MIKQLLYSLISPTLINLLNYFIGLLIFYNTFFITPEIAVESFKLDFL